MPDLKEEELIKGWGYLKGRQHCLLSWCRGCRYVEDVDPVYVVEEFVVAKKLDVGAEQYDNDNSNDKFGVEFGYEGSKVVPILYVGDGCCNSTIKV